MAALAHVLPHAPWRLPGLVRTGPIGVDFGTERLNLVQFDGARVPTVRAAASVAYGVGRDEVLADAGLLRALLDPVLRRAGFSGRRVVVALPPGRVTLRFAPYRRVPGADDAAAIVAALGEQRAALDDVVLDYLPIRPKSEEQAERAALVAFAP
ncbi:MAG: hypothetical protein RLW62_12355, partial [Gammaproteobacteria bacterium]